MSTDIFLVESADFSSKIFSVEERNWLVDRITNNIETASSLAKRYNINRNTLNNYVYRRKKGTILQAGVGRPRLFSQESINLLEGYSQENPKPSIDDFKGRIKEIFKEQHHQGVGSRDNHSIEQPKRPRISKRSVGRYANLCDSLKIQYIVKHKEN